MKKASLSILVFFFLSLLGCGDGEELLSGLDAKHSIDVVVALSNSGIPATREKTGEGADPLYRILVSSDQYVDAMKVIHEYDLPRNEGRDFEQLTRSSGFVPNAPEITNLRLDYLLGLQAERILATLPGVIDVKVLVRSNFVRSLRSKPDAGAPGVSVSIRYQAETTKLPFSVDQARELVAQAIPGIEKNSVRIESSRVILGQQGAVTASSAQDESQLTSLPPFLFKVPVKERKSALLQIVVYFIAFCFAGGVIGVILGSQWTKREMNRRRQGDPRRSFFLEATVAKDDSRTRQGILPGAGTRDDDKSTPRGSK